MWARTESLLRPLRQSVTPNTDRGICQLTIDRDTIEFLERCLILEIRALAVSSKVGFHNDIPNEVYLRLPGAGCQCLSHGCTRGSRVVDGVVRLLFSMRKQNVSQTWIPAMQPKRTLSSFPSVDKFCPDSRLAFRNVGDNNTFQFKSCSKMQN